MYIQPQFVPTPVYDKDMLKDVKDDTSGYFKQLLMCQIQGQRNESPEFDQTEAQGDAKNLYAAGEGKKWGTDESTWVPRWCAPAK